MQNKALLYTLGAVALAIVAGAVVLNMQGGFSGLTATVDDADFVSESTSLSELLLSTDARTCTMATEAGGAKTEGKIYVAGGQLRGDFTTSVNGQTTTSHLLVNNSVSYLWTDSGGIGFYLPFSQMSGAEGSTSGIDASAKMEYACKGWAADESKFTLPKNITFQAIR